MAKRIATVGAHNGPEPLKKAREIPSITTGQGRLDLVIALTISIVSFIIYLQSLAPSVAAIFDDSLEFQLVSYQLGIAHPTGYPLFVILGKLFTYLPFGDVAFRTNLMSAVWGALAIGLLYLCIVEIGQPESSHEPTSLRLAGASGSLLFALSPIFWSQAVITEVYTLSTLFLAAIFFLAFRWTNRITVTNSGVNFPYAVVFVFGLSLTHHRVAALMAPALMVLLWANRRCFLSGVALFPTAAKMLTLFLAPLLLYLYIPLRGLSLTSLDGTYQNTLSGFLAWITASQYSVFLTADPWARAANMPLVYGQALLGQFSIAGIVLAFLGTIWLLVNRRVVAIALLVAFMTFTGFALLYRVADSEPFFLPSFLVVAIFTCFGLFPIYTAGKRIAGVNRMLLYPVVAISITTALYLPYANYQTALPLNDLSRLTEPKQQGLELLSQPLEENAVIVGLLGETTLIRFLQETEGIRKDIKPVAADDPKRRLEVITNHIDAGNPVYVTRPLEGLAEKYALKSVGPLIRVLPVPDNRQVQPAFPLNRRFADAIVLLGYEIQSKRLAIPDAANSSLPEDTLRITLFWQPLRTPDKDYSVFVHVLDDRSSLIGQKDGRPVRDAYPTGRWREGEIIVDTIDVPLKAGTPPGNYSLVVGIYSADGQRLRTENGEQSVTLGTVRLGKAFYIPRSIWAVEKNPLATYSNGFSLLSATVDRKTVGVGEKALLELTWKGIGKAGYPPEFKIELAGSDGKRTVVNQGQPVYNTYPPTGWDKGEIVLDKRELLIPGTVNTGEYTVYLAVDAGNSQKVGSLQVAGRERNFTAPDPQIRQAISFDDSISLLGYDIDVRQIQDRQQGIPHSENLARTIDLTLYWQATGTPAGTYAVFVHLLDERGTIIAQQDSPPVDGKAPTASWIAGEFIEDRHILTTEQSSGKNSYILRVGMYDPTTGQRLSANGSDHINLPIPIP